MDRSDILRQFQQIRTPRLIIRKIEREDAAQILNMTSDERLTEHLGWSPNKNIHEVNAIIDRRLKEYEADETRSLIFAIADLNDNLIGNISYKFSNNESLTCEIGYWIGREYWNNGYASEALRACLKYGFEVMGFERIQCCCIPENIASWKVMEKVGMVFEGILRKSYYMKGKLYDDKVYSMLKDEYKERLM